MNVLIIQPPLVQLNTAYPSGAYLSAFFRRSEFSESIKCVRWLDLSLALFESIFSRDGLSKLFSLCSGNALRLASDAEKKGDVDTALNLRRYVGTKNLWIEWIDRICAILRADGSGFENAHRFVFGAHVPRGARMERFLAELGREPTTDDARSLASFALADIADFISVAFDGNFSLVRYAESLTVGESSFREVEKGADSPILREFFEPLLERVARENAEILSEKCLVLVSVPFAGTFAAALSTGRFFKNRFRGSFVSLGGGFVSTELRTTREERLCAYCDALSFDRGYGGYRNLVSALSSAEDGGFFACGDSSFYKLRLFLRSEEKNVRVVEPVESDAASETYEAEVTRTLVPDFSGIDFSRYPRLIDDTNPMHRLWSDGAWIKAYMAHGCYWHKCAFCDVTLDYVRSFCPTNIRPLYESLLCTAERTGTFGIHFVDEAMPPALMVEFARLNLERGAPLSWWGNVRFEKYFSRDVADFLAAGGLVGVSAGLESATRDGLSEIHKGTDLESIVSACCAFKEAGILVHAYMIYGYWWEKPENLVNSMETLRQFYAEGLLDSCFWHKFVLTRHSRAYKEWSEGKIPALKPVEPKDGGIFASNAMHFEGERKSEKFSRALEISLENWMHGEGIGMNVQKWFDFPVPRPTVPRDFIGRLVEKYESRRDEEFARVPQKNAQKIWLGGEKIPLPGGKIGWFYMGEWQEARADAPEREFRGRGLCVIP